MTCRPTPPGRSCWLPSAPPVGGAPPPAACGCLAGSLERPERLCGCCIASLRPCARPHRSQPPATCAGRPGGGRARAPTTPTLPATLCLLAGEVKRLRLVVDEEGRSVGVAFITFHDFATMQARRGWGKGREGEEEAWQLAAPRWAFHARTQRASPLGLARRPRVAAAAPGGPLHPW